jgi:hypothetical protein
MTEPPPTDWRTRFLAALRSGASFRRALRITQVSLVELQDAIDDAAFVAAWLDAVGKPSTPPLPAERLELVLAELRASGDVPGACRAGRLSAHAVYAEQRRNPAFGLAWLLARCEQPTRPPSRFTPLGWQERFLIAFRQGQSVQAACRAASVSRTWAYREWQIDPAFADAWDTARVSNRGAPKPCASREPGCVPK